MNHLNYLCLLNLITGLVFSSSFALADSEPLRSERIKEGSCQLIHNTYPDEVGGWSDEPYLASYDVEISEEKCLQMEAIVFDKKEQDFGPDKITTRLDIQFKDEDFTCKVRAERKLTIDVSEDLVASPVLSSWRYDMWEAPSCYVNAPRELVEYEFEGPTAELIKVEYRDLPRGTYIPDYLELGEPDDGTAGVDYNSYLFVRGGEKLGYIVEFWYANSEGEWATRYILKYNIKGKMLGNLISQEGFDYCDYPFFPDDDEDWENSLCRGESD